MTHAGAPEAADDGPVEEFDWEKKHDQLLVLLHLEANLWRGSLVSRPSLKRADSGDILYGMEIQKRILASGAVRWRVRWRQAGRYRSQTFDRKGDAVTFGAELRRRQQLGTLTSMDMGRVTLGEYVVGTWCEAYASQLSPKTWMHYRQLLNKHILPPLGAYELRSIRPETIAPGRPSGSLRATVASRSATR